MLIPSKVNVFEESSYLLDYEDSIVNVLHIDEMQNMPEVLLHFEDSRASMHLFGEDKDSAVALLTPIAQTFDVHVDIVTLIEGWLKIDVKSNKYGNISKFISSAKQLLPKKLIAAACMATYIIEKLSYENKKISFAESCTGGLLTYFFTKNNGSSKILDGSLVTYSNSLKENWLGVESKTLEENGAVSNEVVLEMANGVMNVSEADYTLSVSGIAGDSGGTDEKPVGTVYIGIKTKTLHQEIQLQLNGDRNYVQEQSVLYAVKSLVLMDKDMFF
jgi:nicotinamide-nucleotide amidase